MITFIFWGMYLSVAFVVGRSVYNRIAPNKTRELVKATLGGLGWFPLFLLLSITYYSSVDE